MKKIISISIAMLLLTGRPALATVVSTFDGTDLDGWSASSDFNLTNPGSGGNTNNDNDGYVRLGDEGAGVSDGLAIAPDLGALSGYASISWDALLPDNWNEYFGRVLLIVSNNTASYTYTPFDKGGQADVWQNWTAPLVYGQGWQCTLGCSTGLHELLADNTVQVAFDLEVTWRSGSSQNPSIEAGLDNVRLNPIPVPPALWLFGSGLLGLVGIARRRQT